MLALLLHHCLVGAVCRAPRLLVVNVLERLVVLSLLVLVAWWLLLDCRRLQVEVAGAR